MSIELLRECLKDTISNGIFFDNASMGPVAPLVTQAMTDCMKMRECMPMRYFQYTEKIFPVCKMILADMIGSNPDEIAFTENVTYGINSAAGALPLKAGENVILCDREFPSNVYPWKRLESAKDVEARIVPNSGGGLTVDVLNKYADNNTRAVTVSSVEFSDGFATDLEAVGIWCREHGAFFVVDCAQSLGVMPMNVEKYNIDFMAGLSSKWLLGPFSTGFLYVRKQLLKELIPPFVGADSMKTSIDSDDYCFDLKNDASRFEGALPNAPGVAGLKASLELMKRIGLDKIHDSAWNVSGYFIEKLCGLDVNVLPASLNDKTRSTIVSFIMPDNEKVYNYLRQVGISCSFRRGFIRMGIHGYNTMSEVDEVISVLGSVLKHKIYI